MDAAERTRADILQAGAFTRQQVEALHKLLAGVVPGGGDAGVYGGRFDGGGPGTDYTGAPRFDFGGVV